ncbi:hypothetical protein PENANT_c011G06161 [Penicillium antarcticum]|uniref:Short-chain dehydrogenase n=1 Tax=Penicillium antarcticum TaxID=416450 RepID=A0A1V6Q8B9_9EURO|nr:uncharacterized protein N7508_003102 [Penicillium antarcticum]KAJ5312272.1 hypothetical protein N7508_003102 [Penicillium antarcticum]OQD85046.1 hypothetical protein PENANT_c011G06161 [Penicillium antarcticum]
MPAPYNTNTTTIELVTDYKALMKDKVILTTGVSPGSLGGTFVQSLAEADPAYLILAGRNTAKLEQCVSELHTANPNLKTRTLQIDLGSLKSVRSAAEQVNSWTDIPTIDVLVNNAGIMATEYGLSEDGVESQFATNHLGPFLFTNLVMGKILNSEAPRVVMVTSDGHRLSPIRFDDYNFDGGETYNKWAAYGQAKTANMLMALSLSSKLGVKNGLLAFSLHPGVIFTNLGSHLDWSGDVGLQFIDRQLGNREGWAEFNPKTLERGAATHIYAAFDPALKANNGAYLIDCHVADPLIDTVKPWGTSHFEAERLWKLSEELVGQDFAY